MKATNRCSIRSRMIVWTGLLLLGLIAISPGQENRILPQGSDSRAGNAETDFTVRIAVEEVRLDVVVVDKKGHQVANLGAGDFAVYQDDVPMEILSCTYIADQAKPSAQPSIPSKISKTAPLVPAPPLTRNRVRRVIAFVIDDLSMSFEHVHYARMALKNFVEKQMESGDIAAVLRTSRGNSEFQMFQSDKQQLLARIDAVHWGGSGNWNFDQNNLYDLYDSQLSTIHYCVNALKDMPGRKALVLVTAQTGFPTKITENASDPIPVNYQLDYADSYNKMADLAMRAGVVIHTLDIRGLEAPFADPSGLGGGTTPDQLSQRYLEERNPLSAKTGGLFIENTNFFLTGIEEVNEALKGYYLLSYAPPPTTFQQNRREIYHRTKVRVKHTGLEIHTRDGFYGTTASAAEAVAGTSNPLRDAIYSPFQFADLKVSLASGYVNDPKAGYIVRSWLHLNWDELAKTMTAKDTDGRTIALKEGEGCLVDLETVYVTSDVSGKIGDSSIVHYLFRIREENIDFIKEHGMSFSLALPIKRPGAYYIRVAAKDKTSGKIGSAYQFVNVPNLLERRLALSNLFLINRDEDVAAIQSVEIPQNRRSWLVPMLKKDDGKSPAIRDYQPGETFKFMVIVYNAKHDKEREPDLAYQYLLFRDGQEVSRSQVQPVDLKGIANLSEIPVTGQLVLGNDTKEGDYVLQFMVRDKRAGSAFASQVLDFKVSPTPSSGKVTSPGSP
jgi:VWFA-related protein